MDFTRALSDRFGASAAAFGGRFIDALGLPAPRAGEFYETNIHSGKLAKLIVFHEKCRLGLRFYEPYTVPFHDNVLQPLVKVEAGMMDIDIVPLVANGVTAEDRDGISARLRRNGIEWGDDVIHNAGYIDGDHPVVFDICETLTYGLRRNFREAVGCPVQSRTFAGLAEKGAAMLGGNGLPEPATAVRFFRAAKEMAAGEPEVFGGADDGQSAKAARAAMRYGARLNGV
jgi:hypothetical protein